MKSQENKYRAKLTKAANDLNKSWALAVTISSVYGECSDYVKEFTELYSKVDGKTATEEDCIKYVSILEDMLNASNLIEDKTYRSLQGYVGIISGFIALPKEAGTDLKAYIASFVKEQKASIEEHRSSLVGGTPAEKVAEGGESRETPPAAGGAGKSDVLEVRPARLSDVSSVSAGEHSPRAELETSDSDPRGHTSHASTPIIFSSEADRIMDGLFDEENKKQIVERITGYLFEDEKNHKESDIDLLIEKLAKDFPSTNKDNILKIISDLSTDPKLIAYSEQERTRLSNGEKVFSDVAKTPVTEQRGKNNGKAWYRFGF